MWTSCSSTWRAHGRAKADEPRLTMLLMCWWVGSPFPKGDEPRDLWGRSTMSDLTAGVNVVLETPASRAAAEVLPHR